MINDGEKANYWLLGDIRLRAATKDDAAMFLRHFGSSPAGVERAFDEIRFPPVQEDADQWLARYGGATPESGGDARVFVIADAEDGGFLGYIDVWEADRRNGVFKTGIKMLEGKAGKGFATRAFVRVMEYYFNELRYQKCDVYIYEFNEASHHFHKKLGFVEEGRLRREYYTNGRFYDAIYYGLTAEDFRARALTYVK